MRLHAEFMRLPLTFDAARMAEEAARFDQSAWRPHLPLVSAGGDPASDAVKGPMGPTPYLERCPYLQEVLASLRSPAGRTRLIRIEGESEPRADASYYAVHRARVHVPVVTNEAVRFSCGGVSVHMAAGEAWTFDTSRPHAASNRGGTPAVHLVADVVPSDEFWTGGGEGAAPLRFEARNYPTVMSPAEQESLIELLADVPAAVRWFLRDWRELWHRHGESPAGWPSYRELIELFDAALEALPERERVRELLVRPALNPELHAGGPALDRELHGGGPAVIPRRRLERPVFIVSPPRAGSTMLLHALWRSPSVFVTGGESHELIESIEALHPARHGWESNRLTAADATPELAAELEARFVADLRARDGSRTLPPRVRMVEKTTKNLLRIPFLRALFPDALFICLHRDARATIASLLEVWRSGRMVTYPRLPDWEGPPWTLTLVPGWRALRGRPLEEIVAHQWSEGMRVMLDDLAALERWSWCAVSYEALVAEPQRELERLCAFAGLGWDRRLTAPLPLSTSTLTEPSAEKWRRHAEAIERVADRFEPVAARAKEWFA